MPSKAYSMMACGEAIIGIGSERDDLCALIERHGIGISLKGTEPQDLADSIKRLHDDVQLLNKFKANARKAAEDCYSTGVLQERYTKLLNNLLYAKD